MFISDTRGNVEVFYVKDEKESHIDSSKIKAAKPTTMISNRRSLFSFAGVLVPYFDSEWSFAHCQCFQSRKQPVFAFLKDGSILSLDYNMKAKIIEFDLIFGGDCQIDETVNNFWIGV